MARKFILSDLFKTILIILSSSVCFGQSSSIIITGRIVDKATQEPLPYATVSIKGKSIGVVSNQMGEFAFGFSDQYANDTLVVSMMGYETFKRIVKQIKNRDNLFVLLDVKTTMLNEVVVTGKELTPKEIIQRAILSIKLNYPQEPYLLGGFYRDYKKENEKYIALLEAAVSIYDKGYTSQRSKRKDYLEEDVYINEIRKSKTVDYKAKVYKNTNLVGGMMSTNDVRYVSHRALDVKRNKYELEKYAYQDERLVYVIKTDSPWLNRIFIDTESFAILKVEMDAQWEGIYKNEWKVNDSIMNRTSYIKKTLKFKKSEGKYFPEYMNYAWRIEGFKKGSDKILFTSDFYQELLVNRVVAQNPVKPTRENLMSTEKIVELQTKPYNEAFWQNYNIIRESPLDKRIAKDLEQQEALEDQFKKSDFQKKEEKASKRIKAKRK